MTTPIPTAWAGGPQTPRTTCVLAPNAGPMTLDGTNTWIVHEPGADEALVVDPGPDDEAHLRAVLDVVEALGARVGLTVLTHRHHDHSDAVRRFAEMTGAPVRAVDPAFCVDGPPLADGETLGGALPAVTVVATPGHTDDSVCLLLPADRALLTGDSVLGRGTTVVAHPDGALAPYLASLRRLADLARSGAVETLLPGHGPVLTDALGVLEGYLVHRAERLQQVAAAVAAGARTPHEVVERVYADVDRAVWPAAEQSVRAQLDYLGVPGEPS